MAEPRITQLEVHEYAFSLQELGTDYNGFNLVYTPGSSINRRGYVSRIFTDVGLIGEYAGGGAAEYSTLPGLAHYLIGKNAVERERIYTDVKRGRACDEAKFYWYEDPYRDGGISQFAHRKLRQLIRTPLLITEHVRSLEPHIDFALAEATDFVRGDVGYDGITGVMKLAHACEALGIDIEFHGPGPAQRQCMAAIRNTNYYEIGLLH